MQYEHAWTNGGTRTDAMNATDHDITRGTTNVFADLGLPDAAERRTKTRLALAVNELVKARKLKQGRLPSCCTFRSPRSPPSSITASISFRSNV